MKCRLCGQETIVKTVGRPKGLNDVYVRKLKNSGMSLRQIAKSLAYTHGAIQASLKRSEKK